MRLLIKSGMVNGFLQYAAHDHDDQTDTEPLGIGTSPDEAIGHAVRMLYLESRDDSVTITDITSAEDDDDETDTGPTSNVSNQSA